ncbi:MAG: alpha/beta hydrolase [Arthrospira sp. SH-MAG29]|nr:alpha/beta hydrolase [Arthrospira sp. SH-MAG29]MBS0015593.1 alpha/beta hydrolase [Arthrospira sp. SH-MAG29]
MKLPTVKRFRPGLFFGAIASVIFAQTGAIAAERVILTYGPFQAPIKISDLEAFTRDGVTTKTIRQIVSASGLQADTLRGLMGLEIGFDLVPFSCMIYTPTGQELTDEIGATVRTHRRVANGKAIRAGLINALSNDGKISFLEFLQYYPVPGMYVDVANIPATVTKMQSVSSELGSLFRQSSQFGTQFSDGRRIVGGCSAQSVDLPGAGAGVVQPRPAPAPRPAPGPVPRPVPGPAPAPAPAPGPIRGLW